MARKYFGNKLRNGHGSIVLTARLDLATYIESFNHPPPAMFANWCDLLCWATMNALKLDFIPDSMSNIVRVHGDFACGTTKISYSQLWAKACYKQYRDPWANFHKNADLVPRAELTSLHADHVINKERILRSNPEAWVLLFPVPGGANSPFGSAVEKKLPPLPPIGPTGYAIDGLVAFKIFSAEYPRNWSEFEEQLDTIQGQLMSDAFFWEIAKAIYAVWQPQKFQGHAKLR